VKLEARTETEPDRADLLRLSKKVESIVNRLRKNQPDDDGNDD
jgi:hypothetical protein